MQMRRDPALLPVSPPRYVKPCRPTYASPEGMTLHGGVLIGAPLDSRCRAGCKRHDAGRQPRAPRLRRVLAVRHLEVLDGVSLLLEHGREPPVGLEQRRGRAA